MESAVKWSGGFGGVWGGLGGFGGVWGFGGLGHGLKPPAKFVCFFFRVG